VFAYQHPKRTQFHVFAEGAPMKRFSPGDPKCQ
jgi:hypothetical protein